MSIPALFFLLFVLALQVNDLHFPEFYWVAFTLQRNIAAAQ